MHDGRYPIMKKKLGGMTDSTYDGRQRGAG